MSKKAEVVVYDLPEDVLLKILCRLPIKSLIRFTLVSKRWRSIIISDSQFARSTFQHASRTKTLNPRLLMTTHPYYDCSRMAWEPSRFECFADPVSGGSLSVQSLRVPPEVVTETPIASCNGLVVLADRLLRSFENLSLWNPSTGFFRRIPSPEFSMARDLERPIGSVSCGFGHVTATDEYKLVFLESMCFAVHIYSTRDKSWRVITSPGPGSPFPYGKRQLLLSNGAYHWVSNGIPEPALYAFDLAEEKFRQLPLPLALMPGKTERLNPRFGQRLISIQVLLGGCLCVLSRTYYGICEFWKMKEYGVPESWVKMFHFNEIDLGHGWSPIFVTEGGTVLIKRSDKELVRIQCHREEKPVCIGRYKIEEVSKSPSMVYEETLISV